MAEKEKETSILGLTAEIVAAHVANNKVEVDALPVLIQNVYRTLANAGDSTAAATALAAKPKPAVTIKQSVRPDYIVCLEDGRKLKMLKRYLKSTYDLTPEQYRARWNLPADYPMVAPNYARQRSKLAKEIGLGSKTAKRGKSKATSKS